MSEARKIKASTGVVGVEEVLQLYSLSLDIECQRPNKSAL